MTGRARDGLPARFSANAAALRGRLRSSRHAMPPPVLDELHRLPWLFWVMAAAIAIVHVGLLADVASVGWAATRPEWFRSAAAWVTDFGRSGWMLIPTAVLSLMVFAGDWRAVPARLAAAWSEIGILSAYAFFAVGVSGLLTNLIKIAIGRSRPDFVIDGAIALDLFTTGYANASFPSGHAATAGAAMVTASLIFPALTPVFVVSGLAVAFSRVAVGAHFPSDVIAGLAVGIAVAYVAARFLARRECGLRVDRLGRLRPHAPALRSVLRRPGGVSRLVFALADALTGVSRGPAQAPLRDRR